MLIEAFGAYHMTNQNTTRTAGVWQMRENDDVPVFVALPGYFKNSSA